METEGHIRPDSVKIRRTMYDVLNNGSFIVADVEAAMVQAVRVSERTFTFISTERVCRN